MADTDRVVKPPAASVLKSLISKSKTAKAKMDGIKGDIGEDISSAVDKHNLHAGAFKMAAKLERMDAVKLMAWLTHFDDYRSKLELDKAAAANIPGLEDGDDKPKGDDTEKDEHGRPKPMFGDDPTGTGAKPAISVN